jgi:hypothetical protein
MDGRRGLARWGAVVTMLAGLLASACVSAQNLYRCSNGSSSYLSDRPCAVAPPARLGGIGPQQRQVPPNSSSYIPPVGKAPAHLAYLNAACASLNDAIRTGPSRGLKSAAMNDLHAEYREKCAEEEAEAHQKLARTRSDQRDAQRNAQASLQAEQTRTTREREQCHELQRILHGKRQRLAGMTEGEKGDFERSEANYHARCATR